MSEVARAVLLAALAACLGCPGPSPEAAPAKRADPAPVARGGGEPAARQPSATPAPRRVDVHVHLVEDAAADLVAALDRAGIARAVVLASPHLDGAHPPPAGAAPFSTWREANARLLQLSAAHPSRLIPFVTVDPAEVSVAELQRWRAAGACGVKLYAGHRNFHERALAAPEHAPLLGWLEREQIPVLWHINSVRFEAELDELLARYPKLQLVCPHLCGARTDVDRLERILARHPALRVDTSHGPGLPGIRGFANLERERARVRALIEGSPERFMFGSDLVTVARSEAAATRADWDRQLDANLGLLEAERFEFEREAEGPGAARPGTYRGLALSEAALARVLAGNAEAWLAGCP